MHNIEPFYHWRNLYKAEFDECSPFYGRTYSEFEYTHQLYNFLIHPQWDSIDSDTLYIKILYTDYNKHFVIIEMLGEWNDAISNDIMYLKRNVIDELLYQGIRYFILIGENILNFHSSDDCYYEEWIDDLEGDGWIVLLNFRDYVLTEMQQAGLNKYLIWSEPLNNAMWRKSKPNVLFDVIQEYLKKNRFIESK
ncbi:MAG: hypothetical protein OHK0036_09050 [Bacteroidia bacterium]